MTSPYLTVQEVAAYARVDVKTIRRAISDGRLRAFKPVRKLLIREDDVPAWISSRIAPESAGTIPATDEFARLLREAPEAHVVYFIQRGDDGPIKIGHVRRPENLVRRMRALQNACAEQVVARRLIKTAPENCLEIILHARFAEHRLQGEWFSPAPEIVAYMEQP